MDGPVRYRLEDTIATITMDDGKVNVLSPLMLSELNRALDQATADRAAVVLAGRPGLFSAGFDLGVLTAGGRESRDMLLAGFEMGERLLSFPAPVVIACTGHALAMGVFLVLSADYRVGASGDHKISANEVAIGITMPAFGIEICRQRLAPSSFHRAVINAEVFAPNEAVAAGFLDRVVAPCDLRDVARGVAAQLGGLDRGTHTATKLRAREPSLRAIRSAIEADAALVGVALASDRL
jgi:enoyl-CoA hydratase